MAPPKSLVPRLPSSTSGFSCARPISRPNLLSGPFMKVCKSTVFTSPFDGTGYCDSSSGSICLRQRGGLKGHPRMNGFKMIGTMNAASASKQAGPANKRTKRRSFGIWSYCQPSLFKTTTYERQIINIEIPHDPMLNLTISQKAVHRVIVIESLFVADTIPGRASK